MLIAGFSAAATVSAFATSTFTAATAAPVGASAGTFTTSPALTATFSTAGAFVGTAVAAFSAAALHGLRALGTARTCFFRPRSGRRAAVSAIGTFGGLAGSSELGG